MAIFNRGAEAKLYTTKLLGKTVLVKNREKKTYRITELDEGLRRSRTRTEARIMLKAADAGVPVPKVFYVGEFDIWMEVLPGDLLREKDVGKETYGRIGKHLADLHMAGITHGDFTPANIMVQRGTVWLIDFGLSVFSSELEDQAVDLLLMEKAIGKKFKWLLAGYKKNPNWGKVVERSVGIRKRARYVERAQI